jgi:hypothetical protein
MTKNEYIKDIILPFAKSEGKWKTEQHRASCEEIVAFVKGGKLTLEVACELFIELSNISATRQRLENLGADAKTGKQGLIPKAESKAKRSSSWAGLLDDAE